MHDEPRILDQRARRILDQRILPAEVRTVAALDVAAHPVADDGGTPGQGEPVRAEAMFGADYAPCRVGDPWGPAWGTTWFRLRGTVPAEERDAELEIVFDLGRDDRMPGFQFEGLVYRPDGTVVKALNPTNVWIPLTTSDLAPDGTFELYVEAASNPDLSNDWRFVATTLGDKSTAGATPLYVLARADLVAVESEARELGRDLTALVGLVGVLPERSNRAWRVRTAVNDALDVLDVNAVADSAHAARELLRDVLATEAEPDAHEVIAVGHAHIDSAWLWPLRETRRKVARTVANQVALLESGERYVFALPAAQHAAWLKADHPDLWRRLVDAVRRRDVVPVGGMWVETDGNLPGGESMCRQFLHGQRFFQEEFGVRCDQVWLPDSFGYSGALPQLAAQAGATWFLTQKISWNQVDAFPHHTFWWEGIDGTRIFTHFPPVDTYNSTLSATDLAKAAEQFRDKGRSNVSLVPFGHGDGGGGPTREMIAQGRRFHDLLGAPRLRFGTPDDYFERAAQEYPDAPVWVGELYLELHRGTLTSIADIKAGNRRNEGLLRAAELWATTAAVRGLMEYPREELAALWRELLLYQFHDILPGTCIAWVNHEVVAGHARITDAARELIDRATGLLAGAGSELVGFNAAPLPLAVAATGEGEALGSVSSGDAVPAMGAAAVTPSGPTVSLTAAPGAFTLDNGRLRAVVSEGVVTGLFDAVHRREVVPPGQALGRLQLFQDLPNAWDAWDVDAFYRGTQRDLGDPDHVTTLTRDGAAGVAATWLFGQSSATVSYWLRPDEAALRVKAAVDWHERDTLLKLAFPLDVHTDHADYEIQLGHLTRPTHTNTSWDAWRFEVAAQRWIRVAEPRYGIGLANGRTYGWDLTRHARDGGGTWTLARASLLRSPRFPDPESDQGRHHFDFAVLPGADVRATIAAGYASQLPVTVRRGAPVAPLLQVDGPILVEAVKLAEDGTPDVVVRLYEPFGARAEAVLRADFDFAEVVETDLTEERCAVSGAIVAGEGSVALRLRPFQVLTLRFRR